MQGIRVFVGLMVLTGVGVVTRAAAQVTPVPGTDVSYLCAGGAAADGSGG